MDTQWLAVQSFQQSQDLLSALNTLSIHTKLGLSGIPDEARADAAARSRATLLSFLNQLESAVQEAEQGEANPLLGIDSRRRQLVRSFMAARHNRHRFRSALFRDNISRVQQLLRSDKEEDLRSLLRCLEDLRVLLEEHMHGDMVRILGEI